MTSGTFSSVPLSDIWVNRDKRQRRELEGIPGLAQSIARSGLIHPPVVRKTGELIAGERRLEAVRSLGWTHISVQWAEDLPEHELRLIELEENIRRVDLPWQDQVRAVQEYHTLRKSTSPDWSQKQTAEALGFSPQETSHFLTVGEELKRGNTRIVDAPKFSTAKNIVSREAERKRTSIGAKIEGKTDTPIHTGDFITWAEGYQGSPFNLIHCDFPYGIEANNQEQGQAVAEHGGYTDTFKDYITLLQTLAAHLNRLAAPSAHLLFWFSMLHYTETRDQLMRMEWVVNPFPLIWFKSDNSGLLPDPARGPRRVYETCFLASRGDRKIISAVSNVCACPMTKEHHMSEKPLPMLTHFMRMLVDENTTILDPTCGSGNALIAAKQLGAIHTYGLEQDPEFADRARQNWKQAILGENNEQ